MVTTDRGDVVELLDAAGNPFAAYRYDAWGNPQGTGNVTTGIWSQSTALVTGAIATDIAQRQVLRYASYCFDSESGMYYLSSRHYDPKTRQFLSKDLSRNDGDQSAYQYCGGNPVGNVDPTGFRPDDPDAFRLWVARQRAQAAAQARAAQQLAFARAATAFFKAQTVLRQGGKPKIVAQRQPRSGVVDTTPGRQAGLFESNVRIEGPSGCDYSVNVQWFYDGTYVSDVSTTKNHASFAQWTRGTATLGPSGLTGWRDPRKASETGLSLYDAYGGTLRATWREYDGPAFKVAATHGSIDIIVYGDLLFLFNEKWDFGEVDMKDPEHIEAPEIEGFRPAWR